MGGEANYYQRKGTVFLQKTKLKAHYVHRKVNSWLNLDKVLVVEKFVDHKNKIRANKNIIWDTPIGLSLPSELAVSLLRFAGEWLSLIFFYYKLI